MDQSGIRRLPNAGAPPAGVRRVGSAAEAGELAHRLLIPGRLWPVVVLTIPGGHDEPFGDPDEIKEAVGDLAEVVLMPTSDVSWAFSREMPSMTQVYGGAGRVYPVDHGWVVIDPGRSRLRFAYSQQDRRRITDLLIDDALEAALAAGLVEPRTSPGVRQRSGQVQGVIGSRALVTLNDMSVATVWEELTVPGVSLDRMVAKGQSVTGTYDPVSRRLDLRGALRFTDPASARAAVAEAYQVGDVVLSDVAAVTDDAVSVRILPCLPIEVSRDAVTTNPNDTLSGLFTVGEIVACRIVAAEPLRLRLDDVDDEEVPKPAPSLLTGGPPWLRRPEAEPKPPVVAAVRPSVVAPRRPVVPDVVPRRPTPLDLVRRSPTPVPRPAAAGPVDGVSLQERTRVLHLSNELAAERATRKALADELAGLRTRAAQLEAELTHATRSVEQLQTRYRGADLARQRAVRQLKSAQSRADQPSSVDGQVFLDPEDQFRHAVTCEWVQRIPAAEKASKPLAEYVLAPGFLDSIEQLEGISRAKIVAVVVEVLTEQVQHLAGRDLHQLRTGDAGSPYVRRPDGATCWRVALQRESAAARRLHYWRTRDGYEFSRVILHDDYRP